MSCFRITPDLPVEGIMAALHFAEVKRNKRPGSRLYCTVKSASLTWIFMPVDEARRASAV